MKKVILLAVVIIAALFFLQSYRYVAAGVLEDNGFALPDNSLARNLEGEEPDGAVPASPVRAGDFVYRRGGGLFAGEEKTKLNPAFPLFVNGGAAVLNLSDRAALITGDFRALPTYPGLYVSGGAAYNAGRERADGEDYILVGLQNGLYINARELTVETPSGGGTLPVNSVVLFEEGEVRCYVLEGGVFAYRQIPAVNEQSYVSVGGYRYSYPEFLAGLGLAKESAAPAKLPPPPEAPETEPETPRGEKADAAGRKTAGRRVEATGEKELTPREKGTSEQGWQKPEVDCTPFDVELTHASATITVDDPSGALTGELYLVLLEGGREVGRFTYADYEEARESHVRMKIGFGGLTPHVEYRALGFYSYIDAEGKTVDGRFTAQHFVTEKPEEDDSRRGGDRDKGKDGEGDDDRGDGTEDGDGEGDSDPSFVMPKVTAAEFVPGVYDITNPSVTVEDPAGRLTRRGVRFELYRDGRIYRRKVVSTASGAVSVSPLPPETAFTVRGVMTYLGPDGKETEKLFYPDTEITTLSYSLLEEMRLGFTTGMPHPASVELLDTRFLENPGDPIYAEPEDPENPPEVPEIIGYRKYGEATIPYVARLAAELTETGGTGGGYAFAYPAEELRALKRGETLAEYLTAGTLPSNTRYQLRLACYDQYGRELPLAPARAEAYTSRTPPTAAVRLTANTVADARMTVEVKDADGAILSPGGDLRITILNADGRPVMTKGRVIGGAAFELAERHPVGSGDTVQFTNLAANQLYTARITASYDLNDGTGVHPDAVIGEAGFATASIASLGSAYFTTEVIRVEAEGSTAAGQVWDAGRVKLKVSVTERTNPLLRGLLSEITLALTPGDGGGLPLTLTGEELERFLDGNHPLNEGIEISGLAGMTDYSIVLTAQAAQGGAAQAVAVTNDRAAFRTLREMPAAAWSNVYVAGEMIEFFDVRIGDPNGAAAGGKTVLTVTNAAGASAAAPVALDTNADYERLTFRNLAEDAPYTFSFYALDFTQGYDASKRESKRLLREVTVTTKKSLSGSVELESLNYYTSDGGVAGLELFDKAKAALGMNIDGQGDPIVPSPSYFVSDLIPVTPGAVYVKSNFGDSYQFYYDEDGRYFRSVSVSGVNARFIMPEDAHYIRIRGTWSSGTANNVNIASFMFAPEQDEGTGDLDHSRMSARMRVRVEDVAGYLGGAGGRYSLRAYRAQGEVPEDYDFGAPEREETYTITEEDLTGTGDVRVDRTVDFGELKPGSTYRIDLTAVLFGHDVVLGSTRFTTEDTVIGIRTVEELKAVRYNLGAKYVVLNDLEYSGSILWSNQQKDWLSGELDFQGHTLTREGETIGNALFYGITETGVVKNIVLDWEFRAQNTSIVGGICGNNYGTIQNIMVNIEEMSPVPNINMGGVCYTNLEGGLIENFVVNIKGSTYAQGYSAGLCAYNNGTIRNGYVFGEPFPGTIVPDAAGSVLGGFGGAVYQNQSLGRVENVFSLSDTRGNVQGSMTSGTVVGSNLGVVRNCYTTGDFYVPSATGELVPKDGYGPAVAYNAAGLRTENIFYFSDHDYGNDGNIRLPRQALRDADWQEALLGGQGRFNVRELVGLGYFPQVKMPGCMPPQENIPLPGQTADAVALASIKVEAPQPENEAYALLRFQNPAKAIITRVDVKDALLSAEVLSQEDADGFSTVRVRFCDPQKYLSEYEITGFAYQAGEGLPALGVTCPAAVPLGAEFFREIRTVSDWGEIGRHLDENFRLKEDLDFSGVADNKIRVGGTFAGVLDGGVYDEAGAFTGERHILRNIKVTGQARCCVFGYFTGTVKNLTVEDLRLEADGSTAFCGFSYTLGGQAVADNVHFLNPVIAGRVQTGVLAAGMNSAKVSNCSVTNPQISISAGSSTIAAGGLIGTSGAYGSIRNCYVQGADIRVGDVAGCGGAGGLIGSVVAGSGLVIEDCYVQGAIDTSQPNAGGLIGSATTGLRLRRAWADVAIHTGYDYAGGMIGNLTGTDSGRSIMNALAVGNIYSRVGTAANLGRVAGAGVLNAESRVYAAAGQVVEVSDEILARDTLTKLLTGEELRKPETYTGVVGLDGSFDCSGAPEGALPLLRYSDGRGLLPYQEEHLVAGASDVNILPGGAVFYDKTSGGATVQVAVEHGGGTTVEGVVFDENLAAELVKTNLGQPGKTILTYQVEALKFYDLYRVAGILCTTGGTARTVPTAERIVDARDGENLQFFKTIATVDDWQTKIDPASYENYRLTGDIDFSGQDPESINRNFKVNRLRGDPEKKFQISGVDITLRETGESLVNTATSEVSGLTFADISLKSVTAGGTRGIVGVLGGELRDVDFRNIALDFSTGSVGCVGRLEGSAESIRMENVSVNSTSDCIGGLAGKLPYATGAVRNLTAKNIEVVSTGIRTGGIVGQCDAGTSPLERIDITGVTVSGVSYTGGVSGLDGAVTNVTVHGATVQSTLDYAGGVCGFSSAGTMLRCYLEPYADGRPSVVRTGDSNVGGLAGYSNSMKECGVVYRAPGWDDPDAAEMVEVGYDVHGNEILNVQVEGFDRVGGICGTGILYGGIAASCEVTGDQVVGGLLGWGYARAFDTRLPYQNRAHRVRVTGRETVGGAFGRLNTSCFDVVVTDGVVSESQPDGESFGGLVGDSNVYALAQVGAIDVIVNAPGARNVGGAVGCAQKNTARAYVQGGSVTGKENVGGVVGYYAAASGNGLENSYAATDVTATGTVAGGLVGRYDPQASSCYARNSYFAGSVTAKDYAGGLIGYSPSPLDPAYHYGLLAAAKVKVTGEGGGTP